MDNSARALPDTEQALADFDRLGKTLKSAFNPAANSLFSDLENVVTGRELRVAKDNASAFIGTLSEARYEHLEDVASELIVWVDPNDQTDLEELIETADANKLALWPDTATPFTRSLIDANRLQATEFACDKAFDAQSLDEASAKEGGRRFGYFKLSPADEKRLNATLRTEYAERFLSSVTNAQLGSAIALLNRLTGFPYTSPEQVRGIPAESLKQVGLSLRLDDGFVQAVIDLQRLAAELKTDRRRAIALIEAFHRERLPFLWGWFQRGGLPLSAPDRWLESLLAHFDCNCENTVTIFGGLESDDDEPTWCDSFRHDLVAFVLCDEPAVVIRMLERLIEVSTSLLRSVRRRDNFSARYHDVLKLRINCEREGAPLGETPNLWAEVGGLRPIPEADGASFDTLAGMAGFVENAFANVFDAILFAQVEDGSLWSAFWETTLELSVLSEDDENSGETLPFDRELNRKRYAEWYDVLANVEHWLTELLPEAKSYAVICGEVPEGWEDILCDGSPWDQMSPEGRFRLLPHRDDVGADWVGFADSVRPLFTLPDKPLRSLEDFAWWLNSRCTDLRDGTRVDVTMPWKANPPFKELRCELGALTVRNAHRWLDAHHLSGWPGDGLPIPDDVFQQERSLNKLLNWCFEQRHKQWEDESQGSLSNAGDGSPEQDRSHQEAVSSADALPTSTAIGTTADHAQEPPANDSFAALLDRVKAFAATDLKGLQRRVIELLVSSSGEMPIADIATDPAVNWQKPYKPAVDGVKRALNEKLRSLKLRLSVRDNRLCLVQETAKRKRMP